MALIVPGKDACIAEMVKALGLNTELLKSFTIKADAGSVVTIECKYYVTKESVEKITEICKRYNLKAVDEENDGGEIDNG